MPKPKKNRDKKKSNLRHDPLGASLTETEPQCKPVKQGKKKKKQSADDKDGGFLSEKMSKKVMEQAREQQIEVEEESNATRARKMPPQARWQAQESDDDFSDADVVINEEGVELGDDEYITTTEDMSEADMRAMRMFMGGDDEDVAPRLTLADMIMEKIREKEERAKAEAEGSLEPTVPQLDPKVVSVYKRVGHMLSFYKSGKLPKAFKIIPALANWEDILLLTDPANWTPQAMWRSTRLFASNFNVKCAQRFFNLLLLPRVRENIAKFQKLNFHLFVALKKALYKPAAFFKGILLPLCEDRPTVKEAVIIASVLSKKSIPAVHSAAALMKILSLPYYGTHSIFIKAILNKKYALPYRVIDEVVVHFMSFLDESRTLPVLWHQTLLVFAQRYKQDITAAQKEQLKLLLKRQHHHQITYEVRREMFSSLSRGQKAPVKKGRSAMDTN